MQSTALVATKTPPTVSVYRRRTLSPRKRVLETLSERQYWWAEYFSDCFFVPLDHAAMYLDWFFSLSRRKISRDQFTQATGYHLPDEGALIECSSHL